MSGPVMIATGLFVFVCLLALSVIVLQRYFLIQVRRGVSKELPNSGRDRDFELPYKRASEQLLVWGIGMSRVSRDTQMLERIAARGIHVEVQMIDPHWIDHNPAIGELLGKYYADKGLVDRLHDSLAKLQNTAASINKTNKRGRGQMSITCIRAFVPTSGTIADPHLPTAWGCC